MGRPLLPRQTKSCQIQTYQYSCCQNISLQFFYYARFCILREKSALVLMTDHLYRLAKMEMAFPSIFLTEFINVIFLCTIIAKFFEEDGEKRKLTWNNKVLERLGRGSLIKKMRFINIKSGL